MKDGYSKILAFVFLRHMRSLDVSHFNTQSSSVGTKTVPLSFLPAVKITWLVSNLSTMLQLRSGLTDDGGRGRSEPLLLIGIR